MSPRFHKVIFSYTSIRVDSNTRLGLDTYLIKVLMSEVVSPVKISHFNVVRVKGSSYRHKFNVLSDQNTKY